jgi:hypothetical protein
MKSYDFKSKEQYRARVYSEVDKVLVSKPIALRRVAYLDTREALETQFLLGRGYLPQNLLAVNREPVEVALLTRRLRELGLPLVSTAGIEWTRAMGERVGSHGADVLHFDGTSCLFTGLINIARKSVYAVTPRVLVLNMLGGREAGHFRTAIKTNLLGNSAGEVSGRARDSFNQDVNRRMFERIRYMLRFATAPPVLPNSDDLICFVHVTSVAWGVYRSDSGQPMVYCVASLKAHSGPQRQDMRLWAKSLSRQELKATTQFELMPYCVDPTQCQWIEPGESPERHGATRCDEPVRVAGEAPNDERDRRHRKTTR